MKVQEKLKQFQLERKAILATNFYNYETLKGILEAASRVQAPVMLQLTKSSIDYMGLKRAVVLARQGLEDYRLHTLGSRRFCRVGATLPRCRIRVGNDRCQRKEYGGEYRNDL